MNSVFTSKKSVQTACSPVQTRAALFLDAGDGFIVPIFNIEPTQPKETTQP